MAPMISKSRRRHDGLLVHSMKGKDEVGEDGQEGEGEFMSPRLTSPAPQWTAADIIVPHAEPQAQCPVPTSPALFPRPRPPSPPPPPPSPLSTSPVMADMLKGLFGGAKSAVSSVASEIDGRKRRCI